MYDWLAISCFYEHKVKVFVLPHRLPGYPNMSPGPGMMGSGYGPSMNNMPGIMNAQGSPYPMGANVTNNTSGKAVKIIYLCYITWLK